jgi:hypothetical protein
VTNILRWFAQIASGARYFLHPKDLESFERPAENATTQEGDVASAPVTTIAKAGDVAIAPVTANGGARLDADINHDAFSAPDDEEIDRRRNLVRIFFNDFWSGAHEKPAAFVERLDQAEDYLNERLAANSELWRLNGKTRVMLGLPPRSKSS